jgi:hypothetical protein
MPSSDYVAVFVINGGSGTLMVVTKRPRIAAVINWNMTMNMELPDNQSINPVEKIEIERAQELLRVWREKTPVMLRSSSVTRRNGLIEKAGFNPDNIRVIVSPDSVEERVFKTASADSRLAEECASAKGESTEYIHPDAIVIAFDTLVVWYPDCVNPTLPESIDSWVGSSIRKPSSIEEARETTKRVFLSMLTNYANFRIHSKEKGLLKEDKASESDEYAKRDFASGIHAVTSFDIRFPHEKSAENYRDRIIARPQRLYELIFDRTVDTDHITTEDVLSWQCGNERTVGEALDGIIDEVFLCMKESGINPLSISGGVAYSDDGVRELLEINEIADVCPDGLKSVVPDQSIYSGYPETLVQNVLNRRAFEIANRIKI